jgi:hypothetical protein
MVILAISTDAFSQDSGFPAYESTDGEDREKIIYSPGESNIKYVTAKSVGNATKDSTVSTSSSATSQHTAQPPKIKIEKSIAPVTKPTVDKHSKKEDEDSILSFNFLYYIIEKYKLQDIVD